MIIVATLIFCRYENAVLRLTCGRRLLKQAQVQQNTDGVGRGVGQQEVDHLLAILLQEIIALFTVLVWQHVAHFSHGLYYLFLRVEMREREREKSLLRCHKTSLNQKQNLK